MQQRLKSQGGFSLIETIVALTLITVGALALATTFVGAAATNKRVAERQQAISAARQQIDRIRSLDYGDVALFDNAAQDDPDWKETYCPLRINGAAKCSTLMLDAGSLGALGVDDPRQPKTAPQRNGANLTCTGSAPNPICPTVRRNGILLYTYIYWNNWANSVLGQQYKLATVVARFADPKDDISTEDAKRYTTVSLTTIVADIPEVGQVR